ncbi:MAG: copper resistance protein B [Chromatiales bacterium]|jgi:copper resistance protein B|nr:copper resistance protein B [Chromatiales bacterium]
MKYHSEKILLTTSLVCHTLCACAAAVHHEQATTQMFSADRLELHAGRGDPLLYWEIEAWRGEDLDRLWLRTRGEQSDDAMRTGELQLAYRRAVSAFWDVSTGWRGELRPDPSRHWLALGLHGLAPWFVNIDANLYLGESGRSALRVEANQEILFTQRLILEPTLEINAYGRDDPARAIGAGLSTLSASLRLRYAINRKFAPYAGALWEKHYGETAQMIRVNGGKTSAGIVLAGLRFWF